MLLNLARWVSRIVNPSALPILVFGLVAFRSSANTAEALRWLLWTLVFVALIPGAYMLGRVAWHGRCTGEYMWVRALFRRRREEGLILSAISGVPGLILLLSLGAPRAIIVVLVALTATNLFVYLLNHFYRASFHLASISSIVTVVSIVFGLVAVPSVLLIPLLGWARYWLREHTPGQMAAGLAVGGATTLLTFYLFGLLAPLVTG